MMLDWLTEFTQVLIVGRYSIGARIETGVPPTGHHGGFSLAWPHLYL